jgi:hypothetical protein
VRILAAIGIIAVAMLLKGYGGSLGVIGLVLLVTVLAHWCPLYQLVGLSTGSIERKEND